MQYVFRLFCTVILWGMMSGAALACSYPNAFRVVNNTMSDQIDRGGEVSMFVRNTLRRALEHMPADAMLTAMSGEVGRRDLRAARRVLTAADALADGRGLKVDPELRPDTASLREAVELECANGVLSASGGGAAKGVDGGGARKEGGVGRALTFREGMARLSVAFLLYAVFLVALFAFRQVYRARYETQIDKDKGTDQPRPTATGAANLVGDP